MAARISRLLLLLLAVSVADRRSFAVDAVASSQFPAPDFGPNVLVFDPHMKTTQHDIDVVFKRQERNEFGSQRYALLFKPGRYDLDVQAGFYMQALGLGRSPDDVAITGGVRCSAGWSNGNALVNFWRSAENLSSIPDRYHSPLVWAVSQGTVLRRVNVFGDVHLWDGGWSSGGFLADCKIVGQVVAGSQQQWVSRNANWEEWIGGVWNMVFVGTTNPPVGTWPAQPFTIVDRTPLIREKPFLYIGSDGSYFVMVPAPRAGESRGVSSADQTTAGTPIPINQFFLAHPDRDDAASINEALAAGKNLLFTPGIYHLRDSIRVTRPGTVVLGLGYPTLIPSNGNPAMVISDVDGVKVGGLVFDAGTIESPSLMQVGEPGSSTSHASDPIFIYDIVARAGGASPGTCRCFVTLNSSNVVGDNLWLWRADHGKGADWNTNKVRNGLIVNGNDVTIYGLFVEHCQQYQTLWNGNGGRVYFYQSEMPYDPPSQAAWSHGRVKGYASYKVADSVTTHQAFGLGIYCVFNSAAVIADNAIETPVAPGIKLRHMVIVRLGGKLGSGIAHVLNGRGDSKMSSDPVHLSE